MLKAISPIDGRYEIKTNELIPYFSEYALIKYRLKVELYYLEALQETELPGLAGIPTSIITELIEEVDHLDIEAAEKVKSIERITNHDVKAIEYFIKERLQAKGVNEYLETVHFGLTSQDINNTAFPMMIQDAFEDIWKKYFNEFMQLLSEKIDLWHGIPMLARTHGQPASPTSLGKEMRVFKERLIGQFNRLDGVDLLAKFGGATGNFNAHLVCYPNYDWKKFGDHFITQKLGLIRHQTTTQIAHYDDLAELFQSMSRINTILIDFARDMWTYISMDYFKQKVVANEVGSSAMPHKVNPIDFENAEGNFGVANALFGHLADKLPISRLQRDLTDSTVLRNVGVPFGHTIIAFQSLIKGLSKVELNKDKLHYDLENNWAVVAEAIQNILRREQVDKPYEKLKALTRGSVINAETIAAFINELPVNDAIKEELRAITPHNYIGYV